MAAFTSNGQEGGGWTPHIVFSPISGSGRGFADAEDTFYQWQKKSTVKPLEDLGIHTGWCEITPQIAEQLLLRNLKNRKVNFPTMRSYAMTILAQGWKPTGQTITIGKSGRLLDGGHRLWAAYLSGMTITVYVITDIDDESDPNMFAYIDQVRKRTGGEVLHTGGRHNLPDRVARIIEDFAKLDDEDALSLKGKPRGWFMSSIDILNYDNQHPELGDVTSITEDQYRDVCRLLGGEVTGYLAWRIVENHDYAVLHDFMRLLLTPDAALPKGHPVKALRVVMELHEKGLKSGKDSRAALARRQNILLSHQILAYAITAFNLYMQQQQIDNLVVPIQSIFPKVIAGQKVEAAA